MGDPAAFCAQEEVIGRLRTDQVSMGCGRVSAVPAADDGLGAGDES